MKGFRYIIGVVLLVACAQADTESTPSFMEDFNKLTDSFLASQQNPSNFDALGLKIDALHQVSEEHGVNKGVYQTVFNTLRNLRYLSHQMKNSDQILEEIAQLQSNFDFIFDDLNLQRDVDESELPSEINKVIDEFVNRYTASSIELFDNMLIQTKHLEESSEKLAEESSTQVVTFAEDIEKCLAVPKSEFKQVYQCHQDARAILPTLAHNTVLLNAIVTDINQLDSLPLDGEKSVYQLLAEITNERYRLLNHIQELRDQREAEKDNKESNSSSGSNE